MCLPPAPPHRKRLTPHHHAQTVVHYTPNTPCHPHSTEVDCTLSKHAGGFATIDPSTGTRPWPFQATTGGFATIDPRHAGDTPQGSAYGSNSPHRAQASTRAPPSQPSTRRNVGTESRHKPQPHQSQPKAPPSQPKAPPSQHQSTPKPVQKPHTESTQATRSNPNTPNTQHTQHTQHTRRGAAASAVAPLPGSQPETRVT